MQHARFFMFRRSTPFQLRQGCLAIVLLVFLICFCLFFASFPAHSSTEHGCAPDPPPPVSATPTVAPATKGSVEINEVLIQPKSTWNCSEPSGTYLVKMDSWIELYNSTDQPLDLYASHAQVSLDGGTSWYVLPLGSVIEPLKFLVIFPQEQKQVSSTTWNIVLDIDGTAVDQVVTPALEPEQSYARIPDGTGAWQTVGQPTIDASNDNSNQPVTPTPTKTPKPTPIPRPSPTPGSVTAKGESSSGTGGETKTPTTTGTQPAWNKVQLPPGTTESAATTSPAQLLSQSQNAGLTQSNRPGSGQVLLIGLLLLLLLGALIWCWRLFRAP
jgi:hypothetical protein